MMPDNQGRITNSPALYQNRAIVFIYSKEKFNQLLFERLLLELVPEDLPLEAVERELRPLLEVERPFELELLVTRELPELRVVVDLLDVAMVKSGN